MFKFYFVLALVVMALSPLDLISQEKYFYLYRDDNYMILLGEKNSRCFFYPSKAIGTKEVLLIINGLECSESGNSKRYYSVYYDSTEYLVQAKDVKILEDVGFENIVSIDSNILSDRKRVSKELDIQRIQRERKRVSDSLKNIEKQLLKLQSKIGNPSYPVFIKEWSWESSDFLNWPLMNFELYNNSKKRIKYIYINLYSLNRVGDKIVELGKTTKSLTAIGPFEPGETSVVNFKDVWHTHLVHTIKIQSLKIEYFDGTFKNIPNVNEIILSDYEKIALFQN